jgi:acyl dehydratase
MPVDLSGCGYTETMAVSWDSTRAILYALGVGAGQDDPELELEFTTENAIDMEQALLPTFPVALFVFPELPFRDVDSTQILLAGQSLTLYGALPVEGSGRVVASVGGIYDKGSGALVELRNQLYDASGTLVADMVAESFVRGEGGFGGDGGPASTWRLPGRRPDAVIEQATMPWQALLYRLSSDRSPLHTDPEYAALGGFDRPILQGSCTYGYAGRALLQTVFGGEPHRFGSMSARFAAPVIPGDVLRTSVWHEEETIFFVTHTATGRLVLDRGIATERRRGGPGDLLRHLPPEEGPAAVQAPDREPSNSSSRTGTSAMARSASLR